jgi:small subunit ribosomal protein S4
MGDPKKPKKMYKKPGHPWEAERIKEEISLKKEYGLSNKKEIWKTSSKLRDWRSQARHIVSLPEEQRDEMEKALVTKLNRLGILEKDNKIDDILALDVRTILDRRLQSQIYKLGLVNSIKQARQFILHGKIDVNDKIITAPSYLVKRDDKLRLKAGFIPVITKIVRKDEKLIEAIKTKPENKEQTPAKPKTNEQVVEEAAMKATKEASA